MSNPKFQTAIAALLSLAAGCQSTVPPSHADDWVETQMYFGLTLHDGSRITDADWHDFVDRSITPRFPDGLTIIYGDGQYRGANGVIHREPSAILILLHPAGDENGLKQIAEEYDRRFAQESVLMTDIPANATFVTAPTTRP